MARHKTVRVRWGDLDARIDKNIAPLILELWKAGLETVLSCEDNPLGWVWIEFFHASDAEVFLDIVARFEHGVDTLYNRIRGAWRPEHGRIAGMWEYDVNPWDLAVDETEEDGEIEETCCGPSEFVFNLSVRFPRPDLPVVLTRMRRHNKKMMAATLGRLRCLRPPQGMPLQKGDAKRRST
jgi:hypothetical protein